MTSFRRYLLIGYLFALALFLVYPPFLAKFTYVNGKQQRTEFVGHHYVFSSNNQIEKVFSLQFSLQYWRLSAVWVDMQRLLIQWLFLSILAGGILLCENTIMKPGPQDSESKKEQPQPIQPVVNKEYEKISKMSITELNAYLDAEKEKIKTA